MKKTIRLILCLSLMLLLIFTNGVSMMASADESVITTGDLAFDEENVVLSFGVLSDVHICEAEFYGEWEQIYYSDVKFKTAASFLKEKIGEDNMPLLVLGGDLLDTLMTTDLPKAKEVFDATLDPAKTELFITPGNHDVYYSSASYVTEHDPTSLYATKNGFSDYNPYSSFLKEYVYQDKSRTAEGMLRQGYYHTVVNGYHFLSMTSIAGDPTDVAVAWLKNEMRLIREEGNGNKPVFVVTHVPVTAKTEMAFKDYPELVFLTGHTHASLFGNPCVVQRTGSFTTVHCGALKEEYYPEFGMIEIDANDTLRYTAYRMTFTEEGTAEPKVRTYTVTEPVNNQHIFRVNQRKDLTTSSVTSTSQTTSEQKSDVSVEQSSSAAASSVWDILWIPAVVLAVLALAFCGWFFFLKK